MSEAGLQLDPGRHASGPGLAHRRIHQATFVAAGLWNLGWGARTALRPETFFRTAGLRTPERPEVAACLGMVIGLYGVLYLDVARRPEHGGLVAAVGLAGKVLGPAGLALAVGQGRWPARAFLVTVGNDLPWWWPFARYLRDLSAVGFTPANTRHGFTHPRHGAEPPQHGQ